MFLCSFEMCIASLSVARPRSSGASTVLSVCPALRRKGGRTISQSGKPSCSLPPVTAGMAGRTDGLDSARAQVLLGRQDLYFHTNLDSRFEGKAAKDTNITVHLNTDQSKIQYFTLKAIKDQLATVDVNVHIWILFGMISNVNTW